jgi:hypothetical protein
MPPPANIKIYHITPVDNLRQIVAAGRVYSDARRIELNLNCNLVGMTKIKQRRLTQIGVPCHPGTTVGQYVPFYFCPRSIMLFLLHRSNHPDLQYQGGQQPIVHLQADLDNTIRWAEQNGIGWAFSAGNAGAFYAQFYNRVEDLDKLNWAAIASTDFREIAIKEGKQAEFLLKDEFPWQLVEKIGVANANMLAIVRDIVENGLEVRVEPNWYY